MSVPDSVQNAGCACQNPYNRWCPAPSKTEAINILCSNIKITTHITIINPQSNISFKFIAQVYIPTIYKKLRKMYQNYHKLYNYQLDRYISQLSFRKSNIADINFSRFFKLKTLSLCNSGRPPKLNMVKTLKELIIDSVYMIDICGANLPPNLTKLTLINCHIKKINKLYTLKKLKTLKLSHCTVNIEKCYFPENLESLELVYSKIERLAHLWQLQRLKILNLSGNTNLQAHYWPPTLVKLEMVNCGLENIPDVRHLHQLETLILSRNITILRNTDKILDAAVLPPTLKVLEMKQCGIYKIINLWLLGRLAILKLSDNYMLSVGGILHNNPELEILELNNCRNTVMPDLRSLRRLKVLKLSNNHLNNFDAGKTLPPSLVEIDIVNNRLTRAIFAELSQLKVLKLSYNSIISMDGLPPSLEVLVMDNNRHHRYNLPNLAYLRRLKVLDLSDNTYLTANAKLLPPSLEELYLRGCNIQQIININYLVSLITLDVMDNKLCVIDIVNDSIKKFYCSLNKIVYINSLPQNNDIEIDINAIYHNAGDYSNNSLAATESAHDKYLLHLFIKNKIDYPYICDNTSSLKYINYLPTNIKIYGRPPKNLSIAEFKWMSRYNVDIYPCLLQLYQKKIPKDVIKYIREFCVIRLFIPKYWFSRHRAMPKPDKLAY